MAGSRVDRWREEAKAVGFEASALTDVIGRVDGPSAIEDGALDRLFESMAGPHGLTAMSSTFTRADVTSTIAAAVGASLPAGKIDDLAGAFLGDSRRALAVDRLRGARPAVQQGILKPPSSVESRDDAETARKFSEEARKMVEMGQSQQGAQQ